MSKILSRTIATLMTGVALIVIAFALFLTEVTLNWPVPIS